MQCVILVGGIGSRLGAIVKDCPKPFLPVKGKPFAEHLIQQVNRYGFKKFLLLTGYRADVIDHFISSTSLQKDLGISIEISHETSPLGTGGALLNARDHLDDQFVVMNGDSFFDLPMIDFVQFAKQSDALVAAALHKSDDCSRFGTVTLDQDYVSRFQEKTGLKKAGLINSGIYFMRKPLLDHIGDGVQSLEQDIFPSLVTQRQMIARAYDGFFIDIGLPEELDRAKTDFIENITKPAVFFDRDGVLNDDAGYTHKVDDLQWMTGAKEAIKYANDHGAYVFVVTNQAGIARGYYPEEAMHRFHQEMQKELHEIGGHIDQFIHCPHHPDGAIKDLSTPCKCRKPEPGMITRLLRHWPIEAEKSFLIGDKASDILAAEAAGIKGILYEGQSVLDLVTPSLP